MVKVPENYEILWERTNFDKPTTTMRGALKRTHKAEFQLGLLDQLVEEYKGKQVYVFGTPKEGGSSRGVEGELKEMQIREVFDREYLTIGSNSFIRLSVQIFAAQKEQELELV